MASRQRTALRTPTVVQPKASATQGYQPPARAGKRGITFYLPPELWKELRILSIQRDASWQQLMEDAVELLLKDARAN